jgi:acyl CoA:acetate/3-ketoacid CoA transferase
MILEEAAPGIDIRTQITDLCDAELIIPEGGPRLMDERLFKEEPLMLDWK